MRQLQGVLFWNAVFAVCVCDRATGYLDLVPEVHGGASAPPGLVTCKGPISRYGFSDQWLLVYDICICFIL